MNEYAKRLHRPPQSVTTPPHARHRRPSVRVAGRLLIDQATARITPGSRVGLVGRNGSGKSTLFNVITGDHPSEQGHIDLPSRWRVGRLAQEAPNGPES